MWINIIIETNLTDQSCGQAYAIFQIMFEGKMDKLRGQRGVKPKQTYTNFPGFQL